LNLHKAIRKHGKDLFSIVVIASFESRLDALAFEVSEISRLNTMAPNGYNMTCGGEGCVLLSEEAKFAKSNSIKNAHQRPDVKERHISGITASMTPEVRRKIGQSKIGKAMHPNAKAGILAAKKTKEYRKKASEAAAKVWASPKYKENWRLAKLKKQLETASRFPRRDDGLVFSSTRSAASYMQKNGWTNAAQNNISMACNGKYKSSCGHSWSWIDGDEARKAGGIIT
jgi:hypothetical protein